MDPRQLWNRHTVLAEAFCLSDEHVRSAQSALDERQAHRARVLAAFAVTVGNDKAVADLLGLSEREVRVARRTVGKDDARRIAEDMLAKPQTQDDEYEQADKAAAPPPTQQHQHQHQQPQHQQPQQTQAQTQHCAQQANAHHAPYPQPTAAHEPYTQQSLDMPATHETAWTSGMDLVLIDSWQSGIDLRVLADEFGLDLARLVFRVQQLAAEGRLASPQPGVRAEDRAGRHRRDTPGVSGSVDSTHATFGSYGSYGAYGTYGNTVTPSGWEAPATIPEEMVASYLPQQQTSWPQYNTAG